MKKIFLGIAILISVGLLVHEAMSGWGDGWTTSTSGTSIQFATPSSATANNFTIFSGTTGTQIKEVTAVASGVLGYNSSGTPGVYTNMSFDDSSYFGYDDSAPTRRAQWDFSTITSGQTRVIKWPDSNGQMTYTVNSGTVALGTGAISSGTCATVVSTAATGLVTTDILLWGFNTNPTTSTGYSPTASGMLTIIVAPSTDVALFYVCNNTAAAITPSAITLNWKIVR